MLRASLFAGPRHNAFYWNSLIGRGINLGNALEAPKEANWGVRLKEQYFQLIADAGFDSVRIPVRWSDHAEARPPYTIDPAFFARVDWAVEQALSNDLVAIVNMHHYKEFHSAPEAHRKRLLALWKQIAEHYKDHSEKLYFEVFNEPHCSAELWNDIQDEALKVIRQSNPTRAILVEPVDWSRIDRLDQLVLPPDDRNLIVSVHYYEPMTFTHQGAGWIKNPKPTGVPWVGSREERQAIKAAFDKAARWGRTHKRPIHLGEFGAYEKADMASRVRWTAYVRSAAQAHRMSWSYWEFCSSFGVYDPKNEVWRTELLKALLPEHARADSRSQFNKKKKP